MPRPTSSSRSRRALPKRPPECSYRVQVDVPTEGLAIWVEPVRGAPFKKCLRVDYDLKDHALGGLADALIILGALAPSFEAPGDIMRLEHDLLHASVRLWIEPGDSLPMGDVGTRPDAIGGRPFASHDVAPAVNAGDSGSMARAA